MEYIARHAGDVALFFDADLAPLVAGLRDRLPEGLALYAMCGPDDLPGIGECYEALLEGRPESFDWPEFDENAACALCYTSGTTGEPKGVLYSHRALFLHSLFVATAMQRAFRTGRRILPVVPLFHANAWGLPYAAPMFGVSLVMPGRWLDGANLFRLMDAERVDCAYGVPTVWLGLLDEMDRQGRKPGALEEIVVGGSAASRRLLERFEADYGINAMHGWGMTELSPVGSMSALTPAEEAAPLAARLDLKERQGRRMFGVPDERRSGSIYTDDVINDGLFTT